MLTILQNIGQKSRESADNKLEMEGFVFESGGKKWEEKMLVELQGFEIIQVVFDRAEIIVGKGALVNKDWLCQGCSDSQLCEKGSKIKQYLIFCIYFSSLFCFLLNSFLCVAYKIV